jgi:hypothetical protein
MSLSVEADAVWRIFAAASVAAIYRTRALEEVAATAKPDTPSRQRNGTTGKRKPSFKQLGLNAETKKDRHRAGRGGFSLLVVSNSWRRNGPPSSRRST